MKSRYSKLSEFDHRQGNEDIELLISELECLSLGLYQMFYKILIFWDPVELCARSYIVLKVNQMVKLLKLRIRHIVRITCQDSRQIVDLRTNLYEQK